MNIFTIVFCSLTLSAINAEGYWLQRNQASDLQDQIRSPWIKTLIAKQISNPRLRSSKIVSPLKLAPSYDIKHNLGIPASSALGEYRQLHAAVLRETKLQSAQIAENYLRQNADPCMENGYCKLGQNIEEESQYYPTEVSSMDVLEMMLRSVMEDPEADRETLPDLATLKSIVSAFELGTKVGKNENLCDAVFPCAMDKKQGRSTCSQVGRLCPGVIISCSLCGIFSPNTCGTVCNVAAAYCGITGYSCMVAEASTTSTKDAPNAKFDEDVSDLTDIDVEDSFNEVRSLSNDEHDNEKKNEVKNAKEVQKETFKREAQQGETADYNELIAAAAIELLKEKDTKEKKGIENPKLEHK